MRQYEITYLISDDVSDSEITKVTGKVSGLISSADGKVLKEENWGRRKLAYPVNKYEFATYVTLNFEVDPIHTNQIKTEIQTMREVMRLIVVVKDFGKEEITLTAEDIAKSKEIEEVVGGEKSFEAVEGQTDESYELMAKRSETDLTDEPMNKITDEPKDEETDQTETPTVKDTEKDKETEAKEDPSIKAQDDAKIASEEKVEKEESVSKDSSHNKQKPAKKVTKNPAVKTTPAKKKVAKKTDTKDEAERLAKLDKELDDLLGDDL